MTREEEVAYEQDNLGNENRKLDTIRAAEGMAEENDEGIIQLTSANTGSDEVLYSLPTHADAVYIQELHAYNSQSTSGTFSLKEATLDGSGNVTSSVRRSVPIEVVSQSTRINSYKGRKFESAIAVDSEFEGYIGVGIVVDKKEETEPAAEFTG